jgi:HAMP domain-containing protein
MGPLTWETLLIAIAGLASFLAAAGGVVSFLNRGLERRLSHIENTLAKVADECAPKEHAGKLESRVDELEKRCGAMRESLPREYASFQAIRELEKRIGERIDGLQQAQQMTATEIKTSLGEMNRNMNAALIALARAREHAADA